MTITNSFENGPNAGQVAAQAASTGRRNLPLSDTALSLLSTAANRDNGSILPPPADLKARGGALRQF